MGGRNGKGVDYDVAIVGAGPAGLATALHLARIDPRLAASSVLLEAGRHPRDKPCAGGITRGALDRLRALGADLSAIPLDPVEVVRARFGDREAVVRGQPDCYRVTRRGVFDAALAALLPAHGPELVEGARVRAVAMQADQVRLTTDAGDVVCRAVVGADGGSSVVRRSLVLEREAAHVVGLQCLVDSTPCSAHEAVFDFTPIRHGLAGYLWDFPAPGEGRSIGIFARGGSREAASHLKSNVERLGVPVAALGPLCGARVREFDPRARMSCPRVLLVGDAIGLDPLVGEGIGTGLGYGEVAARELAAGFSSGDLSFASYRRAVLTDRVGRSLRGRRLAQRAVTGPGSRLYVGALWPFIVSLGRSRALGPA